MQQDAIQVPGCSRACSQKPPLAISSRGPIVHVPFASIKWVGSRYGTNLQSFYVRLFFFFLCQTFFSLFWCAFFFLVAASSTMHFLHYFSQPCRRPKRSTVCIQLLIITVNSLHTNEFHSESTFLSPICSQVPKS